jgi:paraquat-inducible protein B
MNELPKAKIVQKRRLSYVWLTPILALLITGWLFYNDYVNSGKEIRVQFDTGSGLIIGKTPLKYRGITVGTVTDFEVGDPINKVNVVIKLDRKVSGIASEGMKFWVVKPRVSISQITGLETIISGTYIEVRPPFYDLSRINELQEQDFFIGLPEPPDDETSPDEMIVTLFSSIDTGVIDGAPVFYKDTTAGEVANIRYDSEIEQYRITLAINKSYADMINSSTRFWNLNGLDVKMDSAGLRMQMAPIESLFQGGISFEAEDRKHAPLESYELFKNYSETLLSAEKIKLIMPDCSGIKPERTPVMYKGVEAGIVYGISINKNEKCEAVIRLQKNFEYLASEGSRFFLEEPQVSSSSIKNLSTVILGPFISVMKGNGGKKTEFMLSQEPYVDVPEGSLVLKLNPEAGAAAEVGSGIYYKGIRIGAVTDRKLVKDKPVYSCAIFPEYRKLAVGGLSIWMIELADISLHENGVSMSANPMMVLEGALIADFPVYKTSSPLNEGTALTVYANSVNARRAKLDKGGYIAMNLLADDSFGLNVGSPIYYKGMKAGEVTNTEIKGTGVAVKALLKPEYKEIYTDGLIFWKNGKASVSIDGTGVSADMPNTAEVLNGGLSFEPSGAGQISTIYESRTSAMKELRILSAGRQIMLTIDEGNPPAVSAPVYFKGVRTGEVVDVAYDNKIRKSTVSLIIDKKYADTLDAETRFWSGASVSVEAGVGGITVNTEPALNYLIGALYYDTFASDAGSDKLYKSRLSAEKPDYVTATLRMGYDDGIKEMTELTGEGRTAGYVESVSSDENGTTAKMLIHSDFKDYLNSGTLFWKEEVQIGMDGISNAENAIFGTKLAMKKGKGEPCSEFRLSSAAEAKYADRKGLHIILISDTASSLEPDSPVYYKQVQTGAVEWVKLSENGEKVEIGVFIEDRYADLLDTETVFETVSGIDAGFGLFSGLKVKTASVKSIIKGGLTFSKGKSKGTPLTGGEKLTLK